MLGDEEIIHEGLFLKRVSRVSTVNILSSTPLWYWGQDLPEEDFPSWPLIVLLTVAFYFNCYAFVMW